MDGCKELNATSKHGRTGTYLSPVLSASGWLCDTCCWKWNWYYQPQSRRRRDCSMWERERVIMSERTTCEAVWQQVLADVIWKQRCCCPRPKRLNREWSVTSHILSSPVQNGPSSRRCCSGCRRLGQCPGWTLCYKLQGPGLQHEMTSIKVLLGNCYQARWARRRQKKPWLPVQQGAKWITMHNQWQHSNVACNSFLQCFVVQKSGFCRNDCHKQYNATSSFLTIRLDAQRST